MRLFSRNIFYLAQFSIMNALCTYNVKFIIHYFIYCKVSNGSLYVIDNLDKKHKHVH